jgi:hydroxymethylpyrimidine/phosphomethylpyrimidine kinase
VTARTTIALAVAGSDSGGGAGIQADLKTFAALGVHAATAITALTAQNTLGVRAIHLAPPEIVAAQIDAAREDFDIAAVKIGMLGDAAIVEAAADRLAFLAKAKPRPSVVYDPVMTASSGDALSGAGFIEAVKARLLPLVDCLTPNLAEAAALLGEPIARNEADMARQGRTLIALGPRAVLLKGGHLCGDEAVDILVTADAVRRFAAPKIASGNTHGTGCTLSSAIAAFLTLGAPLENAVERAKAFVTAAVERGADVRLGAGPGPVLPAPLQRGAEGGE